MVSIKLDQTLSARAFAFLTRTIYQHSRIKLGTEKQPLVAARLGKRLRTLGLASFDDYCALLNSSAGASEIEALIDLISTNYTQFFREGDHFEFLQRNILPELASERRTLRVWSAACASGEEPYSLAIVLAECFRNRALPDWQVNASDISKRMLAQAQRGVYEAKHVKLPSRDWLPRYFQKGVGEYAGFYRVKPELQKKLSFHRINLFQPEYPVPHGQDVIFCRNVMIYFDSPSQEALVQRLTRQLARGGYLVVGHSESLLGIKHELEPIRPGIYRRG